MDTGAVSTVSNASPHDDAFAALAHETYLSLTTFRRNGTPVATPVWVVSDDGTRLLVHTDSTSGKVKRLRNNSMVRVGACSSSGAVHGPVFDGKATLLEDVSLVEHLIGRKYGAMARVIGVVKSVQRLVARRPATPSVAIAITAAE